MRMAIVLAVCTGCESAPAPAEPAPALAKHVVALDGFALDDAFSTVTKRAPYDAPCSIEPIDGGLYKAAVFCHGPNAAMIAAGDRIRAFGWVGGDYYASRIVLPLKVGDPVSRAIAVFGKPNDPRESFDLAKLHVDQFDGACVLSEHGTIVGFVFGDMSQYSSAERWHVFDALSSTAAR